MSMQNKLVVAVTAIIMGITFMSSARATLIDRGNGLIYDDDRNITWMQYTNTAVDTGYCIGDLQPCTGIHGLMTWEQAKTFVDWFNNDYNPPWPPGTSNWRLPFTPTAPDTTCSQDFNEGYDCTHSEFGHLYYEELGNSAGEGGLANRGPFRDIEIDLNYWSKWDFVSPGAPAESITFKFRTGFQYRSAHTEAHYVWLIHDGDVAPQTECNDGIDNDSDNRIDMDDPGCQNPGDNDERNINMRYRKYVQELIPDYAFYDFVAHSGRWCPPGRSDCVPPSFSVHDPEKTLPPYMNMLDKTIWKISNASGDTKKINNSLNELNDILNKIPAAKHFDNNMRERLADLINLSEKDISNKSSSYFLYSPVFIKSLNAINLDCRLPDQKTHNIKKGSFIGVDLEGIIYVRLRDVVKPGEMTLKVISGYEAFPADTMISPTWPFQTYSIEFTGQLGSKGAMGLTFYVKPLRFRRDLASIRVLRVEKGGLNDVTTGMDFKRGFVMALTDRPGTFIIVGKGR